MWGESGALGLASESGAVTMVESLSYNPSLVDDEDSYLNPSEYPTQVALGSNCTFVVLNTGRCLSFGGSHLLPDKVSLNTYEIQLEAPILSLSVGAQHVIATCANEKVYTWSVRSCDSNYISETK
jgi:alpha-tubulin suppressor-like RCC1 family protein